MDLLALERHRTEDSRGGDAIARLSATRARDGRAALARERTLTARDRAAAALDRHDAALDRQRARAYPVPGGSFSLGLAELQPDDDAGSLLRRADEHMHDARRAARGHATRRSRPGRDG